MSTAIDSGNLVAVIAVTCPVGESSEHAAQLEAAVDADIAKFDEWFQRELKNAPLIPSEKSCIKTYLYWKTHQEKLNAG